MVAGNEPEDEDEDTPQIPQVAFARAVTAAVELRLDILNVSAGIQAQLDSWPVCILLRGPTSRTERHHRHLRWISRHFCPNPIEAVIYNSFVASLRGTSRRVYSTNNLFSHGSWNSRWSENCPQLTPVDLTRL